MPESTSSLRMTKKFALPSVSKQLAKENTTLPFNGSAVTEKSFSFSFTCFDRTHELFNLGDYKTEGVISGKWFLPGVRKGSVRAGIC